LFVDGVTRVDDASIVTEFKPDAALPFFAGHFPAKPVMPGVLLCECCLQAGALLLAHRRAEDSAPGLPVVTRIIEAKFKRPVVPGDTLSVSVTLDETLADAFFMTGRVTVSDRLAARLRFAVTSLQP